MKRKHISIALMIFALPLTLMAQKAQKLSDEQLIKLYKGLRVADISDGMDMMGLMNIGLVDQSIAPLWRDTDKFEHQITGIALTAKYIPSQKKQVPPETDLESYKKWRDTWYTYDSGEPFIEEIKPGHIIVIQNDGDGKTDTGTVGSYNSMIWLSKGALGVVTSGGIRDIDEVIKQKVPVYTDYSNRGRGIRPGRNILESYNEPIVLGGTLIKPGDVIVADSDGVIVVPRELAVAVADGAREELNIDKEVRRKLYAQLGIPYDFTVE